MHCECRKQRWRWLRNCLAAPATAARRNADQVKVVMVRGNYREDSLLYHPLLSGSSRVAPAAVAGATAAAHGREGFPRIAAAAAVARDREGAAPRGALWPPHHWKHR